MQYLICSLLSRPVIAACDDKPKDKLEDLLFHRPLAFLRLLTPPYPSPSDTSITHSV